MVVAMLVTVGVLFAGLIVMSIGGEVNRKWGNKLMRYRIVAQMVAVVLFLIAVAISRNGG